MASGDVGLPKDAALPAGGDDMSVENIFKTLQKSLVGDDDMLDLIPDVYKSKGSSGSSGKDLIYTDGSGNSRSLTSENPSIQYMIEEFNKITDTDPAIKQFYLALSRNIQQNFDLSDKNDKNDKNTLLLRLRKNSLLLQLPHTWDYKEMQVSLNLLQYTKLSAFNAIKSCKKYNYNEEIAASKYTAECVKSMNEEYEEKLTNVKTIFKKYNTNSKEFELFNQILEIINIIVSDSKQMEIFKSTPFNQDKMVGVINSLVTSFNFETFIIKNFPFPYLNNIK